MKAGEAALCTGEVWHRRNRPTVNEFTYPASHVWINPSEPDALTSLSPLWSTGRLAPVQIRRSDYGASVSGDLTEHTRSLAAAVLGYRPVGPVRMLSQPRRWGWLFNPITLFVLWHENPDVPVAAVAEVTNTPWKERHHYALALHPALHPDFPRTTRFQTEFAKQLHVSPFLSMDYHYELTLEAQSDKLRVKINVCDVDHDVPMVETELSVRRATPTEKNLAKSAFADGLRTRQVSAGIHAQALKIARKRVPFVPHPKNKPASTQKVSHD